MADHYPEIDDTQLLEEWNRIREWLVQGVLRERKLRDSIAARFFPDPVEGAKNRKDLVLEGGRPIILKLNHVVNRSVEEAVIDTVVARIREEVDPNFEKEQVIKYKPELRVGPYKKLPPSVAEIFDAIVTAKPGAPQITIEGL